MATVPADRASTLAALVMDNAALRLEGDPGTRVRGIQYNSTRVKPGDLFVALCGAYFDGHDFVREAVAAGASAVMVERAVDVPVPRIIAQDSRAALAGIAACFFGHPARELSVVGITGTDGKTTTSYLVEHLMRTAGHRTGVIGTVSVRIGDRTLDEDTHQTTPESLDVQRYLRAMADEAVETAIVEATSHGLALHRLDQVRFVTGAVTNITHEHLEFHRTIEAYRRAKARLFERVGESGGVAVVNADDPGALSVLPYVDGARVITYGIDNPAADLNATAVELGPDGSRCVVRYAGGAQAVETRLVGRFNVANMLCALGVGLAHDISLEHSIHALQEPPPIPGRMQPIDAGQPFSVIVDYAHTPESVEKVLRLVRALHPDGRLFLVMGSAGERDVEKRSLQGAAAARLADFSIFTSEDPRFEDPEAIIAGIATGAVAAGGVEGASFARVTDRREAIRLAFSLASPGDCVILAGKGHERSMIWGLEKRPWDEAAVASELLAEMGPFT